MENKKFLILIPIAIVAIALGFLYSPAKPAPHVISTASITSSEGPLYFPINKSRVQYFDYTFDLTSLEKHNMVYFDLAVLISGYNYVNWEMEFIDYPSIEVPFKTWGNGFKTGDLMGLLPVANLTTLRLRAYVGESTGWNGYDVHASGGSATSYTISDAQMVERAAYDSMHFSSSFLEFIFFIALVGGALVFLVAPKKREYILFTQGAAIIIAVSVEIAASSLYQSPTGYDILPNNPSIMVWISVLFFLFGTVGLYYFEGTTFTDDINEEYRKDLERMHAHGTYGYQIFMNLVALVGVGALIYLLFSPGSRIEIIPRFGDLRPILVLSAYRFGQFSFFVSGLVSGMNISKMEKGSDKFNNVLSILAIVLAILEVIGIAFEWPFLRLGGIYFGVFFIIQTVNYITVIGKNKAMGLLVGVLLMLAVMLLFIENLDRIIGDYDIIRDRFFILLLLGFGCGLRYTKQK